MSFPYLHDPPNILLSKKALIPDGIPIPTELRSQFIV